MACILIITWREGSTDEILNSDVDRGRGGRRGGGREEGKMKGGGRGR